MSLVQYGSDSEADSDDAAQGHSAAQPVKKSGLFASLPAPKSQSGSTSGLFASLPPPNSQGNRSPDEQPAKKKRAPIVFTVPVPEESDSEDEDEGAATKRARTAGSAGGSGLFSMLPAPKTGGYYKPSNKPNTSNENEEDKSKSAPNKEIKAPTTTASMVPYALKKKQQAAKAKKPAGSDDDEEDNDDDGGHGSSFLQSLSAPSNAAARVEEKYNAVYEANESSAAGADSYGASAYGCEDEEPAVGPYPASDAYDDDVTGAYPSTEDAYSGYGQAASIQYTQATPSDIYAIQALEGKRGRAPGPEGLNIIDVNPAVELGNTALWRQQYSASQPAAPSISEAEKRANKQLGGQTKRKGQITYLAAHAKAAQSDLEQRWAANKMTKKQLQSRYGF